MIKGVSVRGGIARVIYHDGEAAVDVNRLKNVEKIRDPRLLETRIKADLQTRDGYFYEVHVYDDLRVAVRVTQEPERDPDWWVERDEDISRPV